ncbi:amidase [Pseudomaricurvus alkylphenolicus]|nr:amidase [Pseudomaricurvus alkylphenolicus]
MNLTEVAKCIEAGDISVVALTRMMLQRISALDPHLHSYATVMADQAMTAALRAEKEIASGYYKGPLHGVPIAVKDLLYTQGVRTMGGTGARADFVPKFDATVIRKLSEAGAIVLGKLNLSEGAMLGYHPDFDVPVNPWNSDLWAGASSSGSGVACAAGLCFAALGTDTGGSIRAPAMANGIVGLKPSYGRVSLHGVLKLAPTLDHVGPMARSVEDVAIVFEAMAGFDKNDPTSAEISAPNIVESMKSGPGSLEAVRIGYDREYVSFGMGQELVAAIETSLNVLQGLGAEIVDIELPEFSPKHSETLFQICSYEALRAHNATYPSQSADYGKFFGDFLALGETVSNDQYSSALALRDNYKELLTGVLREVDAVALPSGGPLFSIPTESHYEGMKALTQFMQNSPMRFTIPANFAGVPTISMPCGASSIGVPHSIQLMGSAMTEPMLCRIAYALERNIKWQGINPRYMHESERPEITN